MQKEINNFIYLIKKEKYYDAHEALEELWFPNRKDKSAKFLLIKGFINASVAFELKKRGKLSGALKVWENYKKYLPLINSCSQEDKNIFLPVIEVLENEHKKLLS